ncbi:hypothetical protein [Methylotenera sp.]|uniref:hypothetical protein n=1 Tax=Methylotenera sp. TaxID=2051956 RepID=UPI0024877E8F|nr:hypothetical protein [Methylotenera sp.]MDI1362680.1 hypothetical protein [Methylotenera sp.]
MKKEILLFILSNFLLSGCVSTYKNPEPIVGTAKVRFASKIDIGYKNINVYFFNSDKDFCATKLENSILVASLNGIAISHNRKDLSLPLGEQFSKEAKTEIVVKADEPLLYKMGYYSPGTYLSTGYVQGFTGGGVCLVGGEFTPKLNHIYEVTYNIGDSKCITEIFDLKNRVDTNYERVLEKSAHAAECK